MRWMLVVAPLVAVVFVIDFIIMVLRNIMFMIISMNYYQCYL